MKWYFKVFRQYADFSGRARRKEYWMFVLFNIIAVFVLTFIDAWAEWIPRHSTYGILGSIYMIAVIIPALAVIVRRLHDIGRSGWWICIAFVPVIGGILLLGLMLRGGDSGRNSYGPDPKTSDAVWDARKSGATALIIVSALWLLSSGIYLFRELNIYNVLFLLIPVGLLLSGILFIRKVKSEDIGKCILVFASLWLLWIIKDFVVFNRGIINVIPTLVIITGLLLLGTAWLQNKNTRTAAIIVTVGACLLLIRDIVSFIKFGSIFGSLSNIFDNFYVFYFLFNIPIPIAFIVFAYSLLRKEKIAPEDEYGEDEDDDAVSSSLPDNADYAVLHLFRPSKLVGAIISYNVNLDDSVVFRAKNGSKTSIKITREGKHLLSAKTESRTTLPLNVIFGEEYHVQCNLTMGFFVGHPKLKLVKKETKSATANTTVQKTEAVKPGKVFLERDNRGMRVETMSQSIAYWMGERFKNPRKDPFVYYIFSNGNDAKTAMLELPFIHTAQDSGKIICDELFRFGYYATTTNGVSTGEYDAFVAGSDFTCEMWEQTHAAFAKHNGTKKNDLKPDESFSPPPTAKESGDATQVTFVRESRDTSSVWMVYKAPCKADAMAFLSQQIIDKPLYYVVVETPEGNFGRDKDGMYQE